MNKGVITRLHDEIAQEHGDVLGLLGKNFDFLKPADEIMRLVSENAAFRSKMREDKVQYKYYTDLKPEHYCDFLTSLNFEPLNTIKRWLGIDRGDNHNPLSPLSRESAIKILFALDVSDIPRANQFILFSCGDNAYAFYSRDYKDLIYKFCLQNGLPLSTAESLIEEHKYIEQGSYRLLQSILTKMFAPDENLTQLVWENISGRQKEKTDRAKKVINSFCWKHGIAVKPRKDAFNEYENAANGNNSYIILKAILEKFNVCDEKQIEAFIGGALCEDLYKNEVTNGIRLIRNFCENNGIKKDVQDAVEEKYTGIIKEIDRTSVFDRASEKLKDIPALKKYLEANQNNFGMYRRTAYKRLKYYYELAEYGIIQKDSGSYSNTENMEKLNFGEIYNHMMSVKDDDSVLERIKTNDEWDERIKKNKTRDLALSIVQEIIKNNTVIDDGDFGAMRNFEKQIGRKYFVWIFMYTWGEISDYQTPIKSLNDELTNCGFPTLHSRNPFDFIIINSIYQESILERKKLDENIPENERQKLRKQTFLAFDEAKKIVKNFYNFELQSIKG